MTALPSNHWMPQQMKRTTRKNTWKRNMEIEMWTAVYQYSWRSGAAPWNTAGWQRVAYIPPDATWFKWSKVDDMLRIPPHTENIMPTVLSGLCA